MARVDIIVPAYNAARYLPLALESVVAQTFEDWRILLVDDGSTDDTAAVVAPFLEKLGAKLLYIRQANTGLPGARNAALRRASGEFLALLDADDIWLPSRLEESLESFARRPEAGLSYGLVTLIDANGTPLSTFAGNRSHAEGKIASYIYMRKVELPCPTMTFRRRCVEEVGGFDESLRATEDRDLWLRIARGHEVVCVPKVIALYRTSASSMSADPERMMQAQLQFIEKHYGAPGCGWMARQIALGRVYKQRADAYALRGEPGKALGSALRAVGMFPFEPDSLRAAASLLLRAAGVRR